MHNIGCELRRISLPRTPVNKGHKEGPERSDSDPYKGVPMRSRGQTPSTNLLAYDERVGGHVPEPLVLAGDQHRYEGDQVAEQSVHDAQQRPYRRATEAWNLAIVLLYDLYPQEHLADRLSQVPFQEDVVKDDDHPVEQAWKSGHPNPRNVPVGRPYIRNGRNSSEEDDHHGEQGTEDQTIDDGCQYPTAGDVDVLVRTDERWCNSGVSSHFPYLLAPEKGKLSCGSLR